MWILLPSVALATTYEVPTDFGRLTEAVAAAGTGDTIVIVTGQVQSLPNLFPRTVDLECEPSVTLTTALQSPEGAIVQAPVTVRGCDLVVGARRAFAVTTSGSLTLEDVAVTRSPPGAPIRGGVAACTQASMAFGSLSTTRSA